MMTKIGIEHQDQIAIEDVCIDDVDRELSPIGRFFRHNAMHAGTTRWRSTNLAAVPGVLSLAFGNRTPIRLSF